jgi:hypothetical protein
MSEGGYEFDAATALGPEVDGGGRRMDVTPGWDINGNANGGYVLALAASAMRAASGRPDPVTVTAHYLAPVTAGPVVVVPEIVKAGRRLVTVSARVEREGRQLVTLLGAFGSAAAPGEPIYLGGAPPELPPVDQCVPRSPTQGPVEVTLMDRLTVFLHPDDASMQSGQPSGEGVVRGWFGFADGRPMDTLALLLAADAFPPAVFNLAGLPRGWVPTVELTVHVRGLPAPGLLRARFQTRFVTGDAFEEDSELWDSAGRLVAISRQYAFLARPS